MANIAEKLKHEFLKILPPTIFFFVAFNVISITKSLILRQYGIQFWGFMGAAVGALLVGKVVLLADMLPFVNRFPHKPLIYNILWKTAIYFFAALLVRYLEHLIRLMLEHGGFIAANDLLFDEIVWPHFWSVQIWLLVLFLVYTAFRELVRVIGREDVMKMFFGTPSKA